MLAGVYCDTNCLLCSWCAVGLCVSLFCCFSCLWLFCWFLDALIVADLVYEGCAYVSGACFVNFGCLVDVVFWYCVGFVGLFYDFVICIVSLGYFGLFVCGICILFCLTYWFYLVVVWWFRYLLLIAFGLCLLVVVFLTCFSCLFCSCLFCCDLFTYFVWLWWFAFDCVNSRFLVNAVYIDVTINCELVCLVGCDLVFVNLTVCFAWVLICCRCVVGFVCCVLFCGFPVRCCFGRLFVTCLVYVGSWLLVLVDAANV